MTIVLSFVGIASSTYYSITNKNSTNSENKAQKNKPGRKMPGYTLNQKGSKIPDDTVKEYLCELIAGDGFPYGYKKLTVCLNEDYQLTINHKKVYRLCKELDILRPQRKINPNRPRKLAKREKVTGSNQLWQMDLKYGYIIGTKQFFFQLSVIDVFDRAIIDYHLGLSATAKDASRVLENALRKRGLEPGERLPVIRTDNGPQFIAKNFKKTCRKWRIEHERIPIKSPNLNAYIESFHSILEDECYDRYEFENFAHAYKEITEYMDYYNNRRRHGSIKNMAPNQFYELYIKSDPKTVIEMVA